MVKCSSFRTSFRINKITRHVHGSASNSLVTTVFYDMVSYLQKTNPNKVYMTQNINSVAQSVWKNVVDCLQLGKCKIDGVLDRYRFIETVRNWKY